MQTELQRADFVEFYPITTRWDDNDTYGHVNNIKYYGFFDSTVNRFLIEQAGLDIHNSEIIAFVVESKCQYFSPISYPQNIDVGLRVTHIGRRSVRYELGIFKQNEPTLCALGYLVHVFVQRPTQQSIAIPSLIKQALSRLVVA